MRYLAFEPSTGLLIGVTFDAVTYWNLADGTLVRRVTFDDSSIYLANMSPDGSLALGSFDDSVTVIRDDQTLHTVKAGDLRLLCALNGGLFVTLELDKHGQSQLVRWDDSERGLVGSVVSTPSEPRQPMVVVASDVAPKVIAADQNDQIMLLSLDGKLPPRIFGETGGDISTLAVSPDMARLVCASRAGIVNVLELETGKVLFGLKLTATAS